MRYAGSLNQSLNGENMRSQILNKKSCSDLHQCVATVTNLPTHKSMISNYVISGSELRLLLGFIELREVQRTNTEPQNHITFPQLSTVPLSFQMINKDVLHIRNCRGHKKNYKPSPQAKEVTI